MSEIQPARQDEIDAFWESAKVHAHLNDLAVYWGPTPLDTIQPPAWAFGATAEVADQLAQLVVEGTKTATASALWDYEAEDEPLPEVGGLDIVLDAQGRPRALITTTAVEILRFDDVTAEHARAEGEGDRSLAHWRAVHQEFFSTVATHEHGFNPTMPVVCQAFKVLYAV